MEIKVGIQHVAREVHIESDMSATDVEQALAAARSDHGVLTLTDEKGRKVLIPADAIGYLELGAEHARRVGFGAF